VSPGPLGRRVRWRDEVAAAKRASSQRLHKISMLGPPRRCPRLIPDAIEEHSYICRALRVVLRRRRNGLAVASRSTIGPRKGQIQKRKTSLHLFKSSLQRRAGPYKGANSEVRGITGSPRARHPPQELTHSRPLQSRKLAKKLNRRLVLRVDRLGSASSPRTRAIE
jgi:hypothetical protein